MPRSAGPRRPARRGGGRSPPNGGCRERLADRLLDGGDRLLDPRVAGRIRTDRGDGQRPHVTRQLAARNRAAAAPSPRSPAPAARPRRSGRSGWRSCGLARARRTLHGHTGAAAGPFEDVVLLLVGLERQQPLVVGGPIGAARSPVAAAGGRRRPRATPAPMGSVPRRRGTARAAPRGSRGSRLAAPAVEHPVGADRGPEPTRPDPVAAPSSGRGRRTRRRGRRSGAGCAGQRRAPRGLRRRGRTARTYPPPQSPPRRQSAHAETLHTPQ